MKFHLLSAIVLLMLFNLVTNGVFIYLESQKKLDANGNIVKSVSVTSSLIMLVLMVMLVQRVIKSGWSI